MKNSEKFKMKNEKFEMKNEKFEKFKIIQNNWKKIFMVSQTFTNIRNIGIVFDNSIFHKKKQQ